MAQSLGFSRLTIYRQSIGSTTPFASSTPTHTRRRYVVKRNLITEVYLMNVMENNYMFRPVLAIIRSSMELKG